ncbi:hypothetical protein ACWDO6_20780 [Streptomyces sp. NPDC003674]
MPSSPPKPRPPPPGKPSRAKPPGPTSSRRCASSDLDQAEPAKGDKTIRDQLTRRAGGYIQADVDGWLAHALAAHLGHYRDPAVREEATGLLPPPALAHASLLADSPAWSPDVDMDQLTFAARLATSEPEAAGALALFLARARGSLTPAGTARVL